MLFIFFTVVDFNTCCHLLVITAVLLWLQHKIFPQSEGINPLNSLKLQHDSSVNLHLPSLSIIFTCSFHGRRDFIKRLSF